MDKENQSKNTPQKNIWLAFYVISFVAGGLCLPSFLIWALFFDGKWIGFFICLAVWLGAAFILDRIHKSIKPEDPKLSLILLNLPHQTISWMWMISLGNTIYHFGIALFADGSWWVWLGSLALSAFLKAVTRDAIAQDDYASEELIKEQESKTSEDT